MSDKFGMDLAAELGSQIQKVEPRFGLASFLASFAHTSNGGWASQIAAALAEHLPPHYPDALRILHQILGPMHPADYPIPDQGYKLAPIAHFVAQYGQAHFATSMAALAALATRTYAAQVALRSFIALQPERTLAQLYAWTKHPNARIRRLVSDATRPRLRLRIMPGVNQLTAFIADPRPLLDLLEYLKDDPCPQVRKSVAGNLSDILKDNPDAAYACLTRWRADASKQRVQIVRHALRSARKKGDPRALALLP